LNSEWIEIKNLGDEEVNLKDFKLKDTANQEFIFPDIEQSIQIKIFII
jgi:hypothetical protein